MRKIEMNRETNNKDKTMDAQEKTKIARKLNEQYNGFIGIAVFIFSIFIAVVVNATLTKLGESIGIGMDWAGWLIMPIVLFSMWFIHSWIDKKIVNSYENIPEKALKQRYDEAIQKENLKKANKSLTDRINIWGLIAIAAILFATNPSDEKFVNYLKALPGVSDPEFGKKDLYLISIYRINSSKTSYLGVLNNFFDISSFIDAKN